MKKYRKILIGIAAGALFLAVIFVTVGQASASMPSFLLRALQQGGVQVIVQGDPSASVQLYSASSPTYGSGMQYLGVIGTTDMYGYLGTSVYGGAYNLAPGTMVYVVVNGQQSSVVPWPTSIYPYNNFFYNNLNNYPYYNQYPYYYGQPVSIPITFSIDNPSVRVGESMTVSVSGSGGYYISSNSNPGVVTASVVGSNLYVNGGSVGSSSIVLCDFYTSCRTLTVSVQGYLTYYPANNYAYYPNTYYQQQVAYNPNVNYQYPYQYTYQNQNCYVNNNGCNYTNGAYYYNDYNGYYNNNNYYSDYQPYYEFHSAGY
jgi:hypothetical protein